MKIQYFSPDLSAALGIGHINEMHVETINGVPVLRIECQDAPVYNEYRTVKVTSKPSPKKKAHPASSPKPSPQTRDKDLGGKLMDMGKKFMSNKEKPNFMKDAGF